MPARLASAGLLALMLTACASTPPPAKWHARADADFDTDMVACGQEAKRFDPQSPESYSGQYGAAAAMAGALDQHSIQGGSAERMYAAVQEACMVRKGWKKAS